MLINNKNISTFHGKLIDRVISNNEVATVDDWLDNSLEPIVFRQTEKYKKIKLVLIFETTSEQIFNDDFSKLVNEFKKCEIKFDDLTQSFDCVYDGATEPERITPGVFKVVVELKASHGKATETTKSCVNIYSTTITNNGTAVTPLWMQISTTVNVASMTVTINGTPYIIKNITANIPVIVDGVLQKVTQNGSNFFLNYDAWDFPSLNPGLNNISFSINYATVTFKYKERYS